MEDNRIIDLYWAREEQALTETERKYGGYCRTIARNILKIHEDAEECVSDTWLNAWNAMPPKRPSVLSAFLGKITRNLAFDRWKAAHAEKRGGGSLPLALDELDECIAAKAAWRPPSTRGSFRTPSTPSSGRFRSANAASSCGVTGSSIPCATFPSASA